MYVQFDLIVHNTKKISLDFTDPHFFTNAAEAEATNAAAAEAEAEATNAAEAEATNTAEAETINAAEAKTEATNAVEAEATNAAEASWFGEPSYLYPDNPLGARCAVDGSVFDRKYGNVIKISRIDPTPIMVEHDTSNDTYIMIRDAGYSTRRYHTN